MGLRLLVGGALLLVLGVPASAAYAPGGPVEIRDVNSGRMAVTPPAPTTAHPEVIEPDTQIEPSIAVNPANPLDVVTVYQEGRVPGGGDETNGYATSLDGGRTWVYGELPCLTYIALGAGCASGSQFDRASDAVVTFGPDNVVYANSLVFDDSSDNGLASGIAVNVSKDGGLTWSQPVFLENDQLGGLNDKNWVVVDNSDAAGHHKGRVYVVWDRVANVIYSYCDANCDQAGNWTALTPILQAFVLSPLQGIGSTPLVLKDGSLGVAYTSFTSLPTGLPGDQPAAGSPGGNNVEWALAPGAGQVPFPAPLTFSEVTIPVVPQNSNATRYQRAGDQELLSGDVDPQTGTIFLSWADASFRTESPSVVNDAVVIASSDPDGLTWGPLTRVNGGATNDYLNHYTTAVAASADGVIHVAYRQRQEDADAAGNGSTFSREIDTMYQESRDLGKTWTAPLKVNTGPSDFYYGAFSRSGLFQGDYDQLASAGGYTYITRDESYPVAAGEPAGLKFYPGNGPLTSGSGAHFEGDYSLCPTNSNGPVVSPSCLPHLHQRTWVAVLGTASATAGPTPSAGPVAGGAPNTGAVPTPAGGAVALVGLGLLALSGGGYARRRRRRSGWR